MKNKNHKNLAAAPGLALAAALCFSPASRADEIRGTPISPATNAAPASADAKPARPAAFPHPIKALLTAADLESAKRAGPSELTFDVLGGFTFAETEDIMDGKKDPLSAARKTSEQIPPSIKALNEKEVALKGFMVPLRMDSDNKITEFLLMRSQATCCYGIPPKINEWVMVRMGGKGVKPIMDDVISVRGILHVGGIRENGYLTGIYTMDADKLLPPNGK